jgi:hypothetical protein
MNESDVSTVSRPKRASGAILLFAALLLGSCFALWRACSYKPRSAEEHSVAGRQTIYVHVGFDFIQSPLEGRTGSGGGDVTNSLDIAARMTSDTTEVGSYRGSLKVFRHLNNDAKILIIADCTYDPEAELLEIYPFCAYLRVPDAVHSNASSSVWADSALQLRCLRAIFRFNGVRECDSMSSPATGRYDHGTQVRLMPNAGMGKGPKWYFRIETSSLGYTSTDPVGMWGDLPVGDNQTGMGYLMIDSRRPDITAPKPRTGATIISEQMHAEVQSEDAPSD